MQEVELLSLFPLHLSDPSVLSQLLLFTLYTLSLSRPLCLSSSLSLSYFLFPILIPTGHKQKSAPWSLDLLPTGEFSSGYCLTLLAIGAELTFPLITQSAICAHWKVELSDWLNNPMKTKQSQYINTEYIQQILAENICQWGLTQLWWHEVTLMHRFFHPQALKSDEWTAKPSWSVNCDRLCPRVYQGGTVRSDWISQSVSDGAGAQSIWQATTSGCFSAQQLLENVTPAWAVAVYRHAVAKHCAELEATRQSHAASPSSPMGGAAGGSECAVEEAWFKHTPWAPSASSSSSSPLSKMRGGAREAYAFFNEGPLFCCYGHRTQGDIGKDGKEDGKKEVEHEKGDRHRWGGTKWTEQRNKNIWMA